MASAKLLADSSNREFTLVWVRDNHCEACYFDLFEDSSFKVFDDDPHLTRKNLRVYNYMDKEFLEIQGVKNIKDKYINHRINKDILVFSAYRLRHSYSNIVKESLIINNLKILPELKEKINSFGVSDMVGVHVRMEAGKGLDQASYDHPKNWSEEGRKLMYYWREKSHYKHFMKKMDEILEMNPNQMFFLCTDIKENYDAFISRYGEKICYVKRSLYNRSKEQIQSALIDMILLSRTKYILGSSWSSFTEIAASIGNKNVLLSGRDF